MQITFEQILLIVAVFVVILSYISFSRYQSGEIEYFDIEDKDREISELKEKVTLLELDLERE